VRQDEGRLVLHVQITAQLKGTDSALLKAELKRRSVTYSQLVARLADIGVKEDERNVRNKLSRGKFSAAFMLQCLAAIGSQKIQIAD